MTSYDYIVMVIDESCMIWFHFDCIMQLKKNHIILLLMFVAEKVLLLLVISLTAYGRVKVLIVQIQRRLTVDYLLSSDILFSFCKPWWFIAAFRIKNN